MSRSISKASCSSLSGLFGTRMMKKIVLAQLVLVSGGAGSANGVMRTAAAFAPNRSHGAASPHSKRSTVASSTNPGLLSRSTRLVGQNFHGLRSPTNPPSWRLQLSLDDPPIVPAMDPKRLDMLQRGIVDPITEVQYLLTVRHPGFEELRKKTCDPETPLNIAEFMGQLLQLYKDESCLAQLRKVYPSIETTPIIVYVIFRTMQVCSVLQNTEFWKADVADAKLDEILEVAPDDCKDGLKETRQMLLELAGDMDMAAFIDAMYGIDPAKYK